MRETITIETTWCDVPECREAAKAEGLDGQDTTEWRASIHQYGKRGRKPVMRHIELCGKHAQELLDVLYIINSGYKTIEEA